jgi:PGF-CTERM protein
VSFDGSGFVVGGVSGPTGPVDPGDDVTVRATVRNEGDTGDTLTVWLFADDRRVAAQSVTLGAGEERDVTLTYRPEEDGEYALRVNGQSVGTVLVGSVATPTPTADATTTRPPAETAATEATPATADSATPTPTAGDGPGFGAVAALAGLLSALLLAARRRQSR